MLAVTGGVPSKLVKPRKTSIFPVLIHVNGVLPKVVESGFFTHVIDFGEVLDSHVDEQ